MRNLLAGKLISRIPEAFLRRMELVFPHAKDIETIWRRLLDRLTLNRAELKTLSSLPIEQHLDQLRLGDFHAYELALEREGQSLARGEIPEEYAIAAMGFLYEAIIPFLTGEDPKDREYAATLGQLITVGQFCLVSGYNNHRSASWWAIEEKLRRADQHVQALATHVTEAYEQERRRLSRDLHDEVGHDLAVLKLYLEVLSGDVKSGRNSVAAKKLDEAVSLISKTIEAVRRLAFDLGPGIFDELGFVPATKFYTRRFAQRTGITVQVRIGQRFPEPPNRVKMTLYRVLQGALSNALRHSHAKAIRVSLRKTEDSLRMTIEDDGIGFNVERRLRDPRKAFGLLAMRERIELLEGSLEIVSPSARKGRKRVGTRIEILVPLPTELEAAV